MPTKKEDKLISYYPIDPNLCVFPTDNEAQYESFQSILAAIMYANTVTPTEVSRKSPYELLCNNYNIKLKSYQGSELPQREGYELNTFFNKIYRTQTGGIGTTRATATRTTRGLKPTKTTKTIKPTNITRMTRTAAKKIEITKEKYPQCAICFENKSETHYIGLCRKSDKENVKMYNPYTRVQADDSQGFCQMFAFFLVTDDSGFNKDIDQRNTINLDNFNKLAENTKKCFDKIEALLSFPKNANVLAKFQQVFDDLPKDEYGIKPGTTCAQYFADFSKINSDINAVKYYIHDLDLNGWKQGTIKWDLWESFYDKSYYEKEENGKDYKKTKDGKTLMKDGIPVTIRGPKYTKPKKTTQ